MMKVNKNKLSNIRDNRAFMELKGANPFKISAFRKAAKRLESDDRSLSEIEDFTKIPGIGKGTVPLFKNI